MQQIDVGAESLVVEVRKRNRRREEDANGDSGKLSIHSDERKVIDQIADQRKFRFEVMRPDLADVDRGRRWILHRSAERSIRGVEEEISKIVNGVLGEKGWKTRKGFY